MQNEKLENQSSRVKRNPSRENKNVNQGSGNEKRMDSENSTNRDVETNPTEYNRDEIDLDRSGISNSSGRELRGRESGESSQKRTDRSVSDKQAKPQDFQNSRARSSDEEEEEYDPIEQFDEDEDFGSQNEGEININKKGQSDIEGSQRQ